MWGSIYRFDGQARVFWAEHGPCYRCLYPEPPPPGMVPSCAEGGVLGVLCASIGSIQVTEAIKLLTGIGEPIAGAADDLDALDMNYRTVKVRKDPNCAVCGENPTVTELIDYEVFCGAVSEEASEAMNGSTISVTELADMLEERESGDRDFLLIDVREPAEWEIVSIPGAQLIPKGEFLSGAALADLPQHKPIVVHCKAGCAPRRSWPCSRTLVSAMRSMWAAGSSPGSTRSNRTSPAIEPIAPLGLGSWLQSLVEDGDS